MSEFGISKALPEFSPSKVYKIVDYLKTYLGAESYEDVQLIDQIDLTQHGLLQNINAERLIKYWKKGSRKRKKKASKNRPNTKRRKAKQVVAAGRDYSVTHKNAESMNTFQSVQEVQIGGTSANNVSNLRDVKEMGLSLDKPDHKLWKS